MTFRIGSCVLLLIAFFQCANAQVITSGNSEFDRELVKLRGEVKEIRQLENDRTHVKFRLKLSLNIVNEGYRPVILLKQNLLIGAEMLARSCEDAKTQKYLYTSTAWPSVSGDPLWSRWRESLDSTVPNQNKVWILSAGESVQFEAATILNIGREEYFDGTRKSWDEIKQSPTVCLQVVIDPWAVNLEPNHDPESPEFGRRLREKWEAYGRLQLKHLTSEPIEISLLSAKNEITGKSKIDPEVEANLLIYFTNSVTTEQINGFSKELLLSFPGGGGESLPPALEAFQRIYPPVQGHEGIAIRFGPHMNASQHRTLLDLIRSAPIVYRVLQNRPPNSVKHLEQ